MLRYTIRGILAAAATLGAMSANSAIVTLTGSEFDVQYDTTQVGEFNTPTLVGNVLFFSPNSFTAQSVNGGGTVTNSQQATGIVLIAHSGFQFGNFYVQAQGDYSMTGAASSVSVAGSLTATDAARPLTKTVSMLSLDPSYPLTLRDGVAHNWKGTSTVNDSTPTVTPGYNPWLGSARTIDVSLWNQLTATTAAGSGPQQAFIQEKIAGLQLYVDPVAVPLPAALPLLLSGLAGMGVWGRRRSNQTAS